MMVGDGEPRGAVQAARQGHVGRTKRDHDLEEKGATDEMSMLTRVNERKGER